MQGVILTDVGLSKLLVASPLSPIVITEIAVGDGNGSYPPLTSDMTSLVNEVWRGAASSPVKEGGNLDVLRFEAVIPRNIGGFTVREVAIFDIDGDMIAIGQTIAQPKPVPDGTNGLTLTIRLRIQLSNTSETNLFITESVDFDHRNMTFRDAPDAHPASAITGLGTAALEDVEDVADKNYYQRVTTNTTFVANQQYLIAGGVLHTLPNPSGLTVGATVTLTREIGVIPVIQSFSGQTIRVGKNDSNFVADTSVIFDINAELIFIWNGSEWEI